MQKLGGFSKIKNAFCQKKKRKKEKEDKKQTLLSSFMNTVKSCQKSVMRDQLFPEQPCLSAPHRCVPQECPCP